MPRRVRLDAELVRRGLARSREQARELVAAGRVDLAGRPATKAATAVAPDEPLLVHPDPDGQPTYASRGGGKLAHALGVFADDGLDVRGRRAMDAGASTGGFTDVLLRFGAAEVVAVDVGYGQLAWNLRQDPRVTVLDRTNVRFLDELPTGPVSVVTADLSFIPLELVLPAFVRVTGPELPTADFLVLVKPQFEVGRDRLGSGGVVRDPVLRAGAITGVASAAATLGLGVAGLTPSPLPGPAGNVEYVLWLAAAASPVDPDAVMHAVQAGPQ